jgi:hypothetical protein
VLPGPYARSNFWRWAKLTSIFLIISFHLEQQAWLRACVLSVVSLASNFNPATLIILLIESLLFKNPSTNASWSASIFWLLLRCQLKFMVINTILVLRWFVLSSITSLTFCQLRLGYVLFIPCVPRYFWNCSSGSFATLISNPYLKHHINATSKHDCGIPTLDKNIGSTLPKVYWSIIQTPRYG